MRGEEVADDAPWPLSDSQKLCSLQEPVLLAPHVASLSTLLCKVHANSLLSHELVADDERAAAGVTTTHDITLYPPR